MPKQDFFAFCTTLKPIELKAIGALSRVEHLAAGATVYETGQPGDLLYIINRGVVELLDDSSAPAGSGAFLSRGDVLGEVEALTEQPRRQTARTCEAVSVQIFRRDDFPELLQRVPTFFRFLCNELARRVAEPGVARRPARDHALELSGSLANFDLVTIYQTIVNSAQTGQLSIRNAAGEVISAFYFEAGQPRYGAFEHLIGEQAFWQLFLTDGMAGTFAFSSAAPAPIEVPADAQITRAAGEMLINALQRRDEFDTLKTEFNDDHVVLERCRPQLIIEQIGHPASRPLVERIWRHSDKRSVPLRSLYSRFDVCELAIYQAVGALVRSGHFVLSSGTLADKVA